MNYLVANLGVRDNWDGGGQSTVGIAMGLNDGYLPHRFVAPCLVSCP